MLPVKELMKIVDPDKPGLPIGLNESHLAPVHLDLANDPHLIIFGEAECGKSNLLRTMARTIADRYTPDQARIIMVDFRRSLLGAIEGDHLLEYAGSANVLKEAVVSVKQALENRLPGPEATPEQLRSRSWWRGPDLYIMVDDYDLVATPGNNPLLPLMELVSQARDVGLHLIITRRMGGASRALYETLLQRMRELDAPVLMMSGKPEEGALIGSRKPSLQPAGRGTLFRRSDGDQLIQTAWSEP